MFELKALRCRSVKKAGWRYLDDTLSAGRRAKIEKHLTACLNCRTEYTRRMGVLEALQQGLPINAALVQKTKSARPKRSLRLALIVPAILLAVGVGGYLFISPPPSTRIWISGWKSRISGFFTTSSSADIKEKTIHGKPVKDSKSSAVQPSSTILSHNEAFAAPTASVRVIKPEAEAVMQPVNSEPIDWGSGFGAIRELPLRGSGEKAQRREDRVERNRVQSEKPAAGKIHNPKPETRSGSGSQIKVYDESGQLIKSERVKAGGKG